MIVDFLIALSMRLFKAIEIITKSKKQMIPKAMFIKNILPPK
jgi:hypothetical protein